MNKKVYTEHCRSGFTLIEILVVVFIIALLASIVIINVNQSRLRARDARRLSDMENIRNALEFYYESNRAYPALCGDPTGPTMPAGCYRYSGTSPTNWVPSITPQFLPVLPVDPKNTGYSIYIYGSNGKDFKMMALMEVDFSKALNDGGTNSARNQCGMPTDGSHLCQYELFTPGAISW